MLILTRRVGESVYIGDDIKITVIKKRGNYMAIGVTAPKEISVCRDELYQQISTKKTDLTEEQS